jgi:glycosidase
MGINWLLTLRGIPQLYYGTEILMKNKRIPTDAEVRKDFPGGWEQDPVNKFEKSARTAQEEEAWEYVSSLAVFRKKSSAIGSGKLMQYAPQNGGYVYFRYDNNQSVMIISNTGTKSYKPDWKRFEQRITGFTKLRNVITGEQLRIDDLEVPLEIHLEVQPGESFVFELLK